MGFGMRSGSCGFLHNLTSWPTLWRPRPLHSLPPALPVTLAERSMALKARKTIFPSTSVEWWLHGPVWVLAHAPPPPVTGDRPSRGLWGPSRVRGGGDGRACAWGAATIKRMAWPASPVATGCQGNPCSTGIWWGVSPGNSRGNDSSKSTGRSGRQKAATRRNMRRTGDCPGPRKGATTRRNVTQGGLRRGARGRGGCDSCGHQCRIPRVRRLP